MDKLRSLKHCTLLNAGGEAVPSPALSAVSTTLLLTPATSGPTRAADLLPAVSALLRGLSVPATVVPDEQVCVWGALAASKRSHIIRCLVQFCHWVFGCDIAIRSSSVHLLGSCAGGLEHVSVPCIHNVRTRLERQMTLFPVIGRV